MSIAQRDNIRISYEFALNHVEQDKDGRQIWADYIQSLSMSGPSSSSLPQLVFIFIGGSNMGAAAEDGLASQGVPLCGADSAG